MDLGEYWDSLIHAPIPLGGIVIKRNTDPELQQTVNRLIRKSVEFAFANPESSFALSNMSFTALMPVSPRSMEKSFT